MKHLLSAIVKMIKFILIFVSVVLLLAVGINVYVRLSVRKNIITVDEAVKENDYDCILILGASIKHGDTPSRMLADRLDKGIELYKASSGVKLMMSGDRTDQYYDEVKVMKEYAIAHGVPEEDILIDPQGYSTYESMYRAKTEFGFDKMIVVTQKYHLYRSIYIAKHMGIETYGVAAKEVRYGGQTKRDIREILAIDKDYIMTLLNP